MREAISDSSLSHQLPEFKNLTDFARCCVLKDGHFAYARQLTRRTKVFVVWSEDYMLGKPGDWLLCRAEDPKNVYLVNRDIFVKSYRRCREA